MGIVQIISGIHLKLYNFDVKKYGVYAIVILFVAAAIFINQQMLGKKRSVVPKLPAYDVQEITRRTVVDLIKSGKPLKCEYAYQNDIGNYNGKVYFDNENSRADIDAPDSSGKARLSHQINTKDWMYFWYDGQNLGMKISANTTLDTLPVAETTLPPGNTVEDTVDTMLDLNYTCLQWEVDSTLLEPPTEVTFLDALKFVDAYNKKLCTKCDAETTEASRILCKNMLKCVSDEDTN